MTGTLLQYSCHGNSCHEKISSHSHVIAYFGIELGCVYFGIELGCAYFGNELGCAKDRKRILGYVLCVTIATEKI